MEKSKNKALSSKPIEESKSKRKTDKSRLLKLYQDHFEFKQKIENQKTQEIKEEKDKKVSFDSIGRSNQIVYDKFSDFFQKSLGEVKQANELGIVLLTKDETCIFLTKTSF